MAKAKAIRKLLPPLLDKYTRADVIDGDTEYTAKRDIVMMYDEEPVILISTRNGKLCDLVTVQGIEHCGEYKATRKTLNEVEVYKRVKA